MLPFFSLNPFIILPTQWFSNFREFYYIQMEKFARQALSDGVERSEDLLVIRDMELFRTLNMHYNKSNEFQVRPIYPFLIWEVTIMFL